MPDNTATFANNTAPTSVTISNDASINTILFTTAAPAFNFTTSGTGITFNINGTGIVNNSASAPSFINNDNLNFNSASSTGNLAIINNNGGVVSFNNNSTAANATITTNNGALTQFNDNSTAGNGVARTPITALVHCSKMPLYRFLFFENRSPNPPMSSFSINSIPAFSKATCILTKVEA